MYIIYVTGSIKVRLRRTKIVKLLTLFDYNQLNKLKNKTLEDININDILLGGRKL